MNTAYPRWTALFFPLILAFAFLSTAWQAQAAPGSPVGEVETVKGRGYAISPFGKPFDKLTGDLVAHDEIVGTGARSSMTMRFIDDTTLTLGSQAEIQVDEMVYDPADGDGDAVTLRLGKGTFYFISGKVAKDKVTLVTPSASIGIRGTELVIEVKENGDTSVGVAKGRAFMRSIHGNNEVEIDTGHSAKADRQGRVSDPFPGVDLTGDDDVDRHVPGWADWHGDEPGEREDDRHARGEDGEDDGEKDGEDDAKDDEARYRAFVGDDGFDENDEEADFARRGEDEADDFISAALGRFFDRDGEGEPEGRERERDDLERAEDAADRFDDEGRDFDVSEADDSDFGDDGAGRDYGGGEDRDGGSDGGDDGGNDGGEDHGSDRDRGGDESDRDDD